MSSLSSNPATLADIAKAAGVSRMAAARVLLGTGSNRIRVGPATADRIRTIAQQFDYRPNLVARQLAGKASRLIGVVIDSFAPQVRYSSLAMMERELAARGYRLVVGQVHGEVDRIASYINDFRGRGVEGIVCFSHQYPEQSARIADLFDSLANVVFVGRPATDGAAYVEVDTADGVTQAIDHLLARGRKRIGLALSNLSYASLRVRRDTYLDVMFDRGATIDESLIWSGDHVGDPPAELIDRLVDELVVDQQADSIIATSDIWAVRTIKALKRRGLRVPEDVAVIGHDNTDIAEIIEPELTTIDPQTPTLARHVVELLCEQLTGTAGKAARRGVTVKPQLVVRQST